MLASAPGLPQPQGVHEDRGSVIVDGVDYPLTDDPWEQLPKEPDIWFERFIEYARPLGYDYTVNRAISIWRTKVRALGVPEEELAGAYMVWPELAKRWLWKQRAELWARAEGRKTTKLWAERRRKMVEEDWTAGEELRAIAKDMLSLVPKFLVEGLKEIDGQQVYVVRMPVTPDQLGRMVQTASTLQSEAADAAEALERLAALHNANRVLGASTVAEALQGVLAQPGVSGLNAGDADGKVATLADELALGIARRAMEGDNAALRELRQFVQGDTVTLSTDYAKLLEQLGLTLDDVQRLDPTLAALLVSKRQGDLPAAAASTSSDAAPLAAGPSELSQSGDGADIQTAP